YASPEQTLNAKHADARSDLYSLGCVLYHLLTGRPPFLADNIVALIQAKEKGTFPPARRANAEVPDALDRLLTRMLARLPEQRPDAGEVIDDLTWLDRANPTLSFVK